MGEVYFVAFTGGVGLAPSAAIAASCVAFALATADLNAVRAAPFASGVVAAAIAASRVTFAASIADFAVVSAATRPA
jgi:hypothetical protein